MTQPDLLGRRCVACEKGMPPLTEAEARAYLPQVPDWELREGKSLRRRFRFRDFREAMAFVNRVAALAEDEGHHPDFRISYNRVTVDLTTHAIGGLSENDFILAAKTGRLLREGTA
jgi:4a-hydroxytetrahydrobiopterin dehydratase